jgi:nitroimidazol reductase NimA-like FMN-containing flavoprotein (pyridoxamine 5'-phosphate oxidase superfamily)
MKLRKPLAEMIQWERVCRVATAGKGGMPHLVPVCHVLHNGKIYFASGDEGRKMKNLAENPRVTVTVDCYSDAWPALRGVMVQGTAKLIEGGPRFRRIRALLYRKYPQYPREAPLSESDSVVVEVTPVRVFSWGRGLN